MAEEKAAAVLADTLKEFEPNPGDNPLADIFAEMDEVFAGVDKPAGEDAPEKEAPEKEEPEAVEKEAPEKEEPEADDKEAPEKEEPEADDKALDEKHPDWAKLRAEKDEFKTKYKTAEREAAELRAQLADLPDLREKAKFVEEAEKELAISRVEGTREYREAIREPLARIEAAAEVLAKDAEVSVDRLIDALAEPDPAKRRRLVKEVTADMDSADQNEVLQMARDTQELLAKKERIFSNASESAKEAKAIEERRTKEAENKRKTDFATSVSHVVKSLATKVPFDGLVEGKDAAKLAEWLEDAMSEAPSYDATPDRQAFLVASGILLPKAVIRMVEDRKKIKTLEERVGESNRKSPKVGAKTSASSSPDEDLDLDEQIARHFGTSRPITDIRKILGG